MSDDTIESRPRRVLLLLTSRTYRAPAFLEAAGRLGVEVIKAIDMARPLADYWQYPLGLDYSDLAASTQAILDLAAQRPLAAIVPVDDSGVLLAAQASQVLGLPYNSPQAAEAARDKFVMRTLLSQAGVPVPTFRLFSTADDPHSVASQVAFPCVVKPLRLSGSRGVIRADDEQQLAMAIGRLGRLLDSLDGTDKPHSFLVEQFIPGFEVALEGMLDDGRLEVLALFDKPDPLDGPFFEETIYVTPSRLPPADQSALAGCAAAAAQALGLRHGPVHAELRLNEAGPWLIEVAGRSIGGLCSQTLRFGGDVSLEELILRQALRLDGVAMQREQRAGGVMMIPIPGPGLLRGVEGMEEATAVPGIEEIEITARLNYPLTPLPEGDSYLGFIFARGDTPDEVEAALRAAHGRLRVEIDPYIELHSKR
ncbi:MAG: ATP-grasp domain-containing protein [Chloroflexota bacterium]